MSEFTGDRRRRPLEHECPVGCVMRQLDMWQAMRVLEEEP
jgi:hypothetical protein